MRTINTKVYQFSELSEQAKEKAVEINAYDCEFFDADEFLESLKKFAEHFNCERDMNTLLQAGYKTWFKAANNAYEYQLSKEGYADHCEANEYEFTEDGKRF